MRRTDAPGIHERVSRFITGQPKDALQWLSISARRPLSAAEDSLLRGWLAKLFAHHLRIVATNTSNFIHARQAHAGSGALDTTLLLLERLTITVHLTVDTERAFAIFRSRGVRWKDMDVDPFKAFEIQWVKWCVGPSGRDLPLMREYDQAHAAIQSLMQKAGATTPSARWAAFRSLASGRTLQLGPLSYKIPPEFWRAVNPEWPLSELTLGLLALRHRGIKRGLNRTGIKEELHVQRLERDIGEAWARYGRWLSAAPKARHQVETLLGSLSPFGASQNTTSDNPAT